MCSGGTAISTGWQVLCLMLIDTWSGLLTVIEGSVFISSCLRIYSSYFLERILDCVNTISQHGRIWIFCTITSESPLLLSHVYSFILFASFCCIHLCNLTSHLCHHIFYTGCSVNNFCFDIINTYDVIFWKIQFPSLGFPFVAMSRSSPTQSP